MSNFIMCVCLTSLVEPTLTDVCEQHGITETKHIYLNEGAF